jgi:hypothetical protein
MAALPPPPPPPQRSSGATRPMDQATLRRMFPATAYLDDQAHQPTGPDPAEQHDGIYCKRCKKAFDWTAVERFLHANQGLSPASVDHSGTWHLPCPQCGTTQTEPYSWWCTNCGTPARGSRCGKCMFDIQLGDFPPFSIWETELKADSINVVVVCAKDLARPPQLPENLSFVIDCLVSSPQWTRGALPVWALVTLFSKANAKNLKYGRAWLADNRIRIANGQPPRPVPDLRRLFTQCVLAAWNQWSTPLYSDWFRPASRFPGKLQMPPAAPRAAPAPRQGASARRRKPDDEDEDEKGPTPAPARRHGPADMDEDTDFPPPPPVS